MVHFMMDIETLGTRPGCVVTEIAIVPFDIREFNVIGIPFNHSFDVAQQIDAGLTVDSKTLAWRMRNAPVDFSEKKQITRELFEDFFAQLCPTSERMMWVRGASFDYPIVKELMTRFGIECPWHYRNENDMRTFINAHKAFVKGYEDDADRGNQHKAYFDCLHQINLLGAIFNHNRNTGLQYL